MERPSVRSYSIRGSRITQAQRAAKDELQAIYGIAVEEKKVNLAEIFPTSEKIVMEIGFGMGEATAIIAKNHPNTPTSPLMFTHQESANSWAVLWTMA